MKIAFIHNEKKIGTGAHYINDLMSKCMKESGVTVKNFYPTHPLIDPPVHLKGLYNVLFFYSLLEKKNQILGFDLIQGTTYTPLAFLPFSIPTVSHFGSTTWGFLRSVPLTKSLQDPLRDIWLRLKKDGVIKEVNLRTKRPLRDVAEIEKLVATRVDAVIATSEIVRKDLLDIGVEPDRIHVVPNAIEDYWFEGKPLQIAEQPSLVSLGRIGSDVFTLKLKGIDRLIDWYESHPAVPKLTIGITVNNALVKWFQDHLPNHRFFPNLAKERIPALLAEHAGGVLLIPSRYEGFSLSLVEGMSQGLIPVVYPVGIAPELIRNGENGFLVESQAEGKKWIRHLLALPKEERLRLALAAQESVKKFNSRIITKRLLEVYAAVLKRKARGPSPT